MKKNIPGIVTFFIIFLLVMGLGIIKLVRAYEDILSSELQEENEVTIEDISSKLIRFHVIANSDGELDQGLKLKVRDAVLEYIQPVLKESKSIQESRQILNERNYEILDIAEKVIEDNGYDYQVESTLSKEYFPIKTYGNITLPQGEYEAYRIVIGSGEGQNWWCVMFPPICFVDITKEEIAYEETEEEMKSVLNEKEFNMIDNTKKENNKKGNKKDNKTAGLVDSTEDNDVVIKFKVAEIFKGLFE